MNCIKDLLGRHGRSQTWLASQIGKSYNMVNDYVQNSQQPGGKMFLQKSNNSLITIKLVVIFAIQFFISPIQAQKLNASLITEISSDSLYQNECFVASVQLLIGQDNEVRLRFDKHLQNYIYQIKDQFEKIAGVIEDANIIDIKGVTKRSNGEIFTSYKLYEAAICPNKSSSFTLPSFELYLNVLDSGENESIKDKLKIISKELPIHIDKLPSDGVNSIYKNNKYRMVGDFWIFEEPLKDTVYEVCDTIQYKFNLRGSSVGHLIEWQNITSEEVNIIEVEKGAKHFLYFDHVSMIRNFTFDLVFTKPGEYNLSDYFKWHYFSTEENQVTELSPDGKVYIKGNDNNLSCQKTFDDKKSPGFAVALDISESMRLEDILPNRMGAALNYLKSSFQDSAIVYPLVLFAGEAVVTNNSNIGIIDSLQLKKGTAIGVAIYEGVQVLKDADTDNKVLVIIGDGDNTAGFISIEDAVKIAIQNNVIIYTIGVGSFGKVPFGKDFYGRTRYIEDTYKEEDLREIAKKTGGAFFKLEEEDISISLILKLIHNSVAD